MRSEKCYFLSSMMRSTSCSFGLKLCMGSELLVMAAPMQYLLTPRGCMCSWRSISSTGE